MKAIFLALSALVGVGLTPVAAVANEQEARPSSTYRATVDPSAFPARRGEERKLGATVDPADVRLITPGVDKFSIYKLIGPPHFGEGITRRWNYVLFFPPAAEGTERMRCRMEIRFGPKRVDGYNVAVSEVLWKDQACADRVAASG